MICVLLTLLLPLLSFIFSLLTDERFSWLIILNAPVLLVLSAMFSCIVLFSCWNNPPDIIHISWITFGNAVFTANIFLSNTSVLMMTVVSVISFLVHLYSVGYMAGDGGVKKYFAMLGFFTFAMQGIVLADNLLVLFIFWELVGFSSFMLIGHWTEKFEAGSAAKKAFIFNRIGDAGFLVGIMIVFTQTGTLELSQLNAESLSFEWQTAASLCIFCGVIGKSAQFPLFTWLPDAMEGPTPVSALIHAATMVAAGVYLMIRIFPVFTAVALQFVMIIGLITAISGSVAALFQFDIKKILAYSTMSQLGLMITAIGIGAVDAAFFHLITHAFFKACLFLSAGSIIHALHQAEARSHRELDVQDIRNMGGLRTKMPVTFFTLLISGASLSGIPFFSGFLSKEAMITAAWSNGDMTSKYVAVAMFILSFITALYTFRLIWFVFMGEARTEFSLPVVEAPPIMRAPAVLLAACSVWILFSWNPIYFSGWIMQEDHVQHLPWLSLFSVVWIGIAVATAWYIFREPAFKQNEFLREGFFLDKLYAKTAGQGTIVLSNTALQFDKKVLDGFIHAVAYFHVIIAHFIGGFDRYVVDGLVKTTAGIIKWIGSVGRSFQNGKIQDYISWSVFAIIIFLIWALNHY